MMFVNMVGHASFQTAERSGPSTMDRSYRPVTGGAAMADADGGRVSMSAGAGTSGKMNFRPSSERSSRRKHALFGEPGAREGTRKVEHHPPTRQPHELAPSDASAIHA